MKRKSQPQDLEGLLLKEGWEVEGQGSDKKVLVYGQYFPIVHPFAIYAKLYRTETNPTMKYTFMVKMHHILWPQHIKTWNYWTEDRFKAHCEPNSFISYAGGASTGKSLDAAKIVILDWLSDPENNAAIVASTTLQALSKRIWGYIVRFMHEIHIDLPFHYTKHPSPQFTYNQKDEIHSMTAMAAGVGQDEQNIKNYIGRHPNKKLILVLDEATDLSPYVLKAVANLEAGEEGKLKVIVIGNSLSKSDLHGALSTPKDSWKNISHKTHTRWATTQKNGICLYFSPYNSPAIHEKDPEKKLLFSKFFITAEQIEERKSHYGENSLDFWRFVLGWWQETNSKDTTFSSEPFLNNFHITRKATWSGLHPLKKVGGFDPAFSTGGDAAILRLGILGHEDSGRIVIDFRDTELVYKLKMLAVHKDAIEIQLADQIIDILKMQNVLLEDVAFDCTGQGRTFAELVKLRAALRNIHWNSPIKIYNSRSSGNKNNQDILIKTPTELWDLVKAFVQTNQIAGIDAKALYQFTTRKLVVNDKTKRRELEHKQDYRNRMSAINPGQGTSPDEADAMSLAMFAAVHRHGFHLEQMKALEQKPDWFSEKFNFHRKEEVKKEEQKKKVDLKPTFLSPMSIGVKGPWN